jgi:hypothetical protein
LSGRASIGIFVADLDAMLVDVISVRMMEMPVMQVVNVVLMIDRGVTATGAMSVIVSFVNIAFRHFDTPSDNQHQKLPIYKVALFGMFGHGTDQEMTNPSIMHPQSLEHAPVWNIVFCLFSAAVTDERERQFLLRNGLSRLASER